MTTACIGPKASEEMFPLCAALEEEFFAVTPEDIHRKGLVKHTCARMRIDALYKADFLSLFICEDNRGHGGSIPALDECT